MATSAAPAARGPRRRRGPAGGGTGHGRTAAPRPGTTSPSSDLQAWGGARRDSPSATLDTLPVASTTIMALQGTAGNRAVAGELHHLQRAPAKTAAAAKTKAPADKPVDVLEAIVNVISARGLAGDVGTKGENISSPRYATEVAKTVLQQEHITMLWIWHLIAVGDPVTHGDAAKLEELNTKTAALITRAKADRSSAKKAAALAARYAVGLEQLRQRAAREQAEQMIDSGMAAAEKAEKAGGTSSDEDGLRTANNAALATLHHATGVFRRVMGQTTSPKMTAAAMARNIDFYTKSFERAFEGGKAANYVWPAPLERATKMNFADSVQFIKGGLDAVNAILAVSDPKARAELFKAKSNYFGTVAQGAEINKVMWQFVSGSIAIGGGGAYAVTKLAGNTARAAGILEATVKGISNVNAAMNLAGLVHGAFVLADPDATADQKAEAAVETAYSALGIAGFAARWTPKLAGMAKWSGPIGASLMINFWGVQHLAGLRHKAQVGLNRLDWAACHKATKAAAIEVQSWQRRLAVTNAILATETNPRRKLELEKYGEAFRSELIDRQLKPFLDARLSSRGADDDAVSCGPALVKRLKPLEGLLGGAAASDDAALSASAAFLMTVDKAFTEWDQIVMEK